MCRRTTTVLAYRLHCFTMHTQATIFLLFAEEAPPHKKSALCKEGGRRTKGSAPSSHDEGC